MQVSACAPHAPLAALPAGAACCCVCTHVHRMSVSQRSSATLPPAEEHALALSAHRMSARSGDMPPWARTPQKPSSCQQARLLQAGRRAGRRADGW